MKRFIKIFVIALLAFSFANVASLIIRSDSYDDPDSRERYGFPFLISDQIAQTSGGITFYPKGLYQYYSPTAFRFDVLIGFAGSVFVALVYPSRFRRVAKINCES